jgi:hypothetical protein
MLTQEDAKGLDGKKFARPVRISTDKSTTEQEPRSRNHGVGTTDDTDDTDKPNQLFPIREIRVIRG